MHGWRNKNEKDSKGSRAGLRTSHGHDGGGFCPDGGARHARNAAQRIGGEDVRRPHGRLRLRRSVTLNFQICEQETYTAEAIEALAAGDVLVAGGEDFAVKAVKTDEYGIGLTGEWYSLFLYKNEDGLYTAVTDTENRFYKNLFGIEVPAPKDLRFVDWSDPEAEEPTVLTLKDLMTRAMNDEINSSADNTEITFDAEGRLSEVVYRYSPWN